MNTKIGLSNIQISNNGGETYKPIAPTTQEVLLKFEEVEPINKYDLDFTKPIEFSCKLKRKRKGTIFERCLYYQKSKKKRIRKKYNIGKILCRGK